MQTISTERLDLRPMIEADAESLHKLFGDAAFMQAFDHVPSSPDQTAAWVGRNLDHQRQHGFGLNTIVLRATGEVIGDCGIEVLSVDGATEAELGYDIARRHWGRGFAPEAAAAVAGHAFEVLGLERVVSLVRAGNGRSVQVARKIGMRLEKTVARNGVEYELFAIERLDLRPMVEARG